MTLIENCDYFIRIVKLPYGIRGAVRPNPDGTFSIYINSRNTSEQEIAAKIHEIEHIMNDDFYNGEPIEKIERLI